MNFNPNILILKLLQHNLIKNLFQRNYPNTGSVLVLVAHNCEVYFFGFQGVDCIEQGLGGVYVDWGVQDFGVVGDWGWVLDVDLEEVFGFYEPGYVGFFLCVYWDF